eukprot:XP_028333175.1 uncharacterized protein LOC112062771 isoform X2 [Physeter catodon]
MSMFGVIVPGRPCLAPAPATAGQPSFTGLPGSQWFIGAITNVKPSALLSTGWAFLPQTSQLPVVKLGMMLENAPSLQEKLLTTPLPDVKKEYARRVALNLYRYLESFQGGAAMPLLDQWFQRFEARYQRDPNFVMKSE